MLSLALTAAIIVVVMGIALRDTWLRKHKRTSFIYLTPLLPALILASDSSVENNAAIFALGYAISLVIMLFIFGE
jgi:hypothetical protein